MSTTLRDLEDHLRLRGYPGATITTAWETEGYRVVSFMCDGCWRCDAAHGRFSPINVSTSKNESWRKMKVWCLRKPTEPHWLEGIQLAEAAWRELKAPEPDYEEEMVNKKDKKKAKGSTTPKKVVKEKTKVSKEPAL